MMIKKHLLLLLAFCSVLTLNAQRYFTPQFSAVTKTAAVNCAQNYTVITLSATGHTARSALRCDIYEPTAALKIDTTRIMVIGENTGAYIAYGMASVDKYSKFLTTQYPQGKFTVAGAGGSVIPNKFTERRLYSIRRVCKEFCINRTLNEKKSIGGKLFF